MGELLDLMRSVDAEAPAPEQAPAPGPSEQFTRRMLRRRAQFGETLTPEEQASLREKPSTVETDLSPEGRAFAREALLFALPGAGIAAGGRIAARVIPHVRRLFEVRRNAALRGYVQSRTKADAGRAAAAEARAAMPGNPFAGISGTAEAGAAQRTADSLTPEIAKLLTRERVARNAIHGAGTMAGGAAGGAGATLLGNELRPDDPQSPAVNAALGAVGPLGVPVAATVGRLVSRLVTGIPSMNAQAAKLAFERAIARSREAGRRARSPNAGPETELGLDPGMADDLSLDFMLRKFQPQTAVELGDETGKRAAGAIGALRLPDNLVGGGMGGILGFLLTPFDAGTSAVTGMLTGYFVGPKIREKVISKAMESPRFRQWTVGQLPRIKSTTEAVTSLTAIAAAEGVREVRDAIETMADNLMQIGEEAADRIMGSGIEITDEVRRELERLRFNPIGEAQGATLPVKPMVPPAPSAPAPQPQPLPPGSRRLQPDPFAREQGQGLERDLQRLRQQRQRQTPTDEEQNR